METRICRTSKKKYLSLSFVTLSVAAGALAVIAACTGTQAKEKPNIVFKEAPKPGIVAKIGGQDITEDDLIGDDKLDFFDLKKREYDLKMDRLNKLMVDRLIGAEAKKAGMSLDDFINKKVIGGEPKISEKEYKAFIAEKHVPESQLNPQLKERIMQYLQTMKKQTLIDNYVAKLTKSEPVEVYFSKPKMNVKVDPGNSPLWGDANAPVTVVEFSDFQCPFCGRANETVGELKKEYNGKIKMYYRQFPLPMHQNARGAAEASLCVNEQGTPKFWKFGDIMFKNQDKLTAADLEKYAQEAGADVGKYKECVAAKKYSSAVQADMDYGEKIGVKSTPTFFINGQLVAGALPKDQFEEIINDELAEAKK